MLGTDVRIYCIRYWFLFNKLLHFGLNFLHTQSCFAHTSPSPVTSVDLTISAVFVIGLNTDGWMHSTFPLCVYFLTQ